jgi:hypothetical protein
MTSFQPAGPEEVSEFLNAVESLKHRVILTVCYAAVCGSLRLSISRLQRSTASA